MQITSLNSTNDKTNADENYMEPTSTAPSTNTAIEKQNGQSASDFSDCGYGTQRENHESVSSSSNEEAYATQKVHQKKPTNQKHRQYAVNNSRIVVVEKKELRRKKLIKRSKSAL